MPCLGRNRRAKSKDRKGDSENKDNEDRSVLRKILKRVSAISSAIIRFLRDIRDGIFRLFGLNCRGTSKLIRKYLPVKIEENSEGAKLFEFSTLPRSFEWNGKESRSNTFVTKAQVHRSCCSRLCSDGDTADTISMSSQLDDENERSECQRNQDFETSSCKCGDFLVAGATGGTGCPSQNIYQPYTLNHSDSDLNNTFYNFFKNKINPYAFLADPDKLLKHILGVITFFGTTDTSDDKLAKVERMRKQCLKAFEKRKAELELESQTLATFQVDENGVVRFTAGEEGPPQPKTNLHKVIEAKRKLKVKVKAAIFSRPVAEVEGQAACQEHDTKTPQNSEVDQSDEPVVAAKIRRADDTEQAKPKSKTSFGAAIKEKFKRSTKPAPATETAEEQIPPPSTPDQVSDEVVLLDKEPQLVPLRNESQLAANHTRFVRIMNRVVQYCIGAFQLEHWTYRVELTVNVHLGPNGENYWNPLFTDSLHEPDALAYMPNVSQTRSTRFVRLVSLESYVDFVGMSPTAEEVLTTLETITLRNSIFERNDSGEETIVTLGSVGDLHWCSELLDVMSYISYYAMIGCSKIMQKIHASDQEMGEKQVLANALHNHVVQKFNHSLKCIIPRMRHAVENFGLEYEALEPPANAAAARPKVQQEAEAVDPSQAQPEAPVCVPKKHGKKKNRHTKATRKRSKSRHKASGAGDNDGPDEKDATKDDANTTTDDLTCNGDLESGDTAVTTKQEINDQEARVSEDHGPDNTVDTAQTNGEVQNSDEEGACAQVLDDMDTVFAADANKFVEWDFADYVSYIETNNTLDYGCHEVMAGHGERPNKKKLAGEIKEKKKTKGIPNKHLEQANQSHDFTMFEEDELDVTGTDDDNTETLQAVCDDVIQEPEPVEKQEVVKQTIDDREFNMVPEEVIRKDDTKLKDLEEAYSLAGNEKKKDKHKKKKEKKNNKGTKLIMDFEFSDFKHR